MIEDQSQVEARRTERAIAIDPAIPDFLNNVSVSGSPLIFAVAPDATWIVLTVNLRISNGMNDGLALHLCVIRMCGDVAPRHCLRDRKIFTAEAPSGRISTLSFTDFLWASVSLW
jgi:hypothetical protein